MMAATPEGESKDNEEAPLKPFQSTFIKFALDATVLRFGTFTFMVGPVPVVVGVGGQLNGMATVDRDIQASVSAKK